MRQEGGEWHPFPQGSLTAPPQLTGLGGAARPWVHLLKETEAAPGWAGACGSLSGARLQGLAAQRS